MGPVNYIKATVDRYARLGHDPYRYFHAEEAPPWAALRKPLPDSRLGVVATAGAYVKGQVAFHYKDDTSFRRIPKTAPLEDLRFSHVTEHYLGSARRDPNSVIPLDSLRRLEREGLIGALAEDLFSCMEESTRSAGCATNSRRPWPSSSHGKRWTWSCSSPCDRSVIKP